MAKSFTKTFTADGSTQEFVCDSFTFMMGNDTASNFGGGTITVELSHDGENFTTDATSYTAGDIITTAPYTGGVVAKITLSGSTSPNLPISVKYE